MKRTHRILIVEDEHDVAELMRAVLEDEGYQVHVHPDGACWPAVQAFDPHVIVCDYMLPLQDGEDVLRELRHERGLTTPFIMISAMRRASQGWRRWGADDFLAKPFDIEHLIGAVQRATSQELRHFRPRPERETDEAAG